MVEFGNEEMEQLIKLTKECLGIKENDERCYDKDNFNYIPEIRERNSILILGINPAGNEENKKYDSKYLQYIPINEKNNSKLKDLISVNYFKSLYKVFDEKKVVFQWVLRKEELKKILSECDIPKEIIENTYKCEYEKLKNDAYILNFADLFYYHDSKQKNIEQKLKDKFGSNFKNDKDLIKKVKEIIDIHIRLYNPKLILISNSLVSKLVSNSMNLNEYNSSYSYSYEENDTNKCKNIPIIFSGMVSGGSMDIFSRIRLKNEIEKYI